MKTTLEKSDTEIKNDVLAELKYEPSVKVTDIGVLVSNSQWMRHQLRRKTGGSPRYQTGCRSNGHCR
jgi:hypothetical protein